MGEAIKIGVCVPSAGFCNVFFMQWMVETFASVHNLSRSRPEAESVSMRLIIRQSSNIPNNREKLVNQALAWGATHIFFADDDMVGNPSLLELLLSRRMPHVGCNYPKRQQDSFEFTAVGINGGRIETNEHSVGMEEAKYMGFGCALIERQVFEKIPKPWFPVHYEPTLDDHSSDDYDFCLKVREAGFKVLVDHTASKHIGHCGGYIYTWRQNPNGPAEKGAPKFTVVQDGLAA